MILTYELFLNFKLVPFYEEIIFYFVSKFPLSKFKIYGIQLKHLKKNK